MNNKEEILEKLKVFNDPNFSFDEETHTYLYKNEVFESVTTFIKKFIKPFDENYFSLKKAKERLSIEGKVITDSNLKIYQDMILQEWTDKKDTACIMGSFTHKLIEQTLNGESIDEIENEEAIKRYQKFKIIYDTKLKDKIINVGQEIKVFSEEMKIAGTIDCLLLRELNNQWCLEIWDWKTNSKFTTDEHKSYNKMLHPFKSDWENELNKYSIQLSLYKKILASKNIIVDGKMIIVHIPENGEVKSYLAKDYTEILNKYFSK